MPRGANNDGQPNKGWFQAGNGGPKTESHRRAIGAAQKIAWQTKRKRMPVGSTWTDGFGYIRVKVTAGAGRWPLQHVLAMEEALGRNIRRGEVVHHVNGDRADNQIENLYLCESHLHHQRIEGQLKQLFRTLLKDGLVRFNHAKGEYEIA